MEFHSANQMDKKHDAYCWKCCGKETTLKCSTCIRSFHIGCMTNENGVDVKLPIDAADNWCCFVCNKLKTSKNTKIELKRIPIIIHRVWKSEYVGLNKKKNRGAKRMKLVANVAEDIFCASDDILNPIDLPKIRAKANSYTSLDEFYADVQWFVHNCGIFFGDNHYKMTCAKKLLKSVSAEIESVKKCVECHINANQKDTRPRWFTMVCNMPHLIIWAHGKNTRYWPAKLMSVDGQTVHVRYFGNDRINDNVPTDKCFLYSEKSPGKAQNAKVNDAKYKLALEEAEQYIKNLREKYGSFELEEPRTPFDPALFNDYILKLTSRIITSPGVWLPQIMMKMNAIQMRN
ncbi:MYND-type zinc finger-containing chromatin reader ZMYND8-like [Sitodiplosis mosellana]|uniref:MYND-type zinc finger-containing chromatin reader ZMYND8-like n=1 Tax=Sitodiplosis mosellana TaxID=263140 RepID=UPI002443C014|nr:MYND-type zinc finger-containing chromatin reader ZMYND8-like [Sitodiplosis mosellana]